MSKIIKAVVLSGRYKDHMVRVTNVSSDELGRRNAACILSDGTRANIPVSDLEVIKDPPPEHSETRYAKTTSMPFISGSSSSRTLTHTKNMNKKKIEIKPSVKDKVTIAFCESCGQEYNIEERKGQPGKVTQCHDCA